MSTREDDLAIAEEHETGDALAQFARRAPRISQADVFRAADELLLNGHRPTIDRVRMRLGRGSPNTINDHLDTWWAKLGARLRDVPGHEFPQLPERVAQALHQLWNAALEGAHETLQGALLKREEAISQREQALDTRTRELTQREQALATRAAGLEESLALAREHFAAANRRAESLEATLQVRDAECGRLQTRIEALEASGADLRRQFDAATAAYHTERTKLQEQYAATEARWLMEVDRARQGAKEAAKDHERQLKELRGAIASMQSDREHLNQELVEARSDLKTAIAVREQLEERLSELAATPTIQTPRAGRTKVKLARKRPRSTLRKPR